MKTVFAFLSIAVMSAYPVQIPETPENSKFFPNYDKSRASNGMPVLQTRNGRYVKNTNRFFVPDSQTPEGILTIDYDSSAGFAPSELAYVKDFIEGGERFRIGMKQCIAMVFGKPFFDISVRLEKKDSPTSYYDATNQVIILQPRICNENDLFPKLETLAHELVHAFSDVLMKPVNCYEEGLAVAQTDLACKLFCEANGVAGRSAEVFDGPPSGTRNYDLLNQEAVAAADGFFWNTSTTSRVVDPSTRYMLAGTVWWKIWRETVPGNITWQDDRTYGPGTFFVDFNKLFFSTFKGYLDAGRTIVFDSDRQTQFRANIKHILKNDKGNSLVEGREFDDWWQGQHIMRTYVDEGPKLYVIQSYQTNGLPVSEPAVKWQATAFPQIAYFYKDSKGNEIALDGRLFVSIASLSNPAVDDPSCLARQYFNAAGEKPLAWSEFEIDGGQVARLVKSQRSAGCIDFSRLPRGGYKIVFVASTIDGLLAARREMYFANKLDLGDAFGLCFGAIDSTSPGKLFCERSSMPGHKTEVQVDGDGTYLASFAPTDILTFTYETIGEAGETETHEAVVSCGTWLVARNLVFR